MKNIDSIYNKVIVGSVDKVLFGFAILGVLCFSYSVFFLLNRPVDPEIEGKIRQESQSANIIFDKRTIKEISESKNYSSPLKTQTVGKNPFLTY